VDNSNDVVADVPTLLGMRERTEWSTPGYVAEQLIGFGVTGEVWRGRSLSTGEPVALKRLYAMPDEDDLVRLEWQTVCRHPHLLRIKEILTDDAAVLVLPWAAGGSLATLLRRRGRLRSSEVVTALGPIAAALAYVHEAGQVHGAVRPANVLFTVDGRPLLAEPLLRSVACGRSDPDVTEPPPTEEWASVRDVYMLAESAVIALTGDTGPDPVARLTLLGGVMPSTLVRALSRALSSSRGDRGSAAELAGELARSCLPEPLRLDDDDAARSSLLGRARHGVIGKPPRATVQAGQSLLAAPKHRPAVSTKRSVSRPGRWMTSAGLAAAASAGALWTACGSAGPLAGAAPIAAPDGPSAEPSSPADWLTVLDRLDAVRARAYEQGDLVLLRQVYAPGPNLTADTSQLGRLTATGDTVSGVRHRLRVTSVTAAETGRARLRVIQALPASVRLHAGEPVATVPGTADTITLIDLVRTPDGWRLA
jgi:hypothetical protein